MQIPAPPFLTAFSAVVRRCMRPGLFKVVHLNMFKGEGRFSGPFCVLFRPRPLTLHTMRVEIPSLQVGRKTPGNDFGVMVKGVSMSVTIPLVGHLYLRGMVLKRGVSSLESHPSFPPLPSAVTHLTKTFIYIYIFFIIL